MPSAPRGMSCPTCAASSGALESGSQRARPRTRPSSATFSQPWESRMTTATPDKPEIVPPAIHPVTLRLLEESLPFIREFLAKAGPLFPGDPALTRDAVDEMRQGFPALDDLTLATICTWAFDGASAVARS